jgi:starch phosphorylase
MTPSTITRPPTSSAAPSTDELLKQYECGTVHFVGDESSLYERHLVFDGVADERGVDQRDRFTALARSIRDLLTQRWIRTQRTREAAAAKRVYYLSMEFLIGRTLVNNIINLRVDPLVREAMDAHGLDLNALADLEPDAGLGNGGLGRLAACFIDSLATLQYPAIGYGLRYEFGIFRQQIDHGWQVEQPDNWLRFPDPWEIARPGRTVPVTLASSIEMRGDQMQLVGGRPLSLLGIPYDRPVVGYGGQAINTLRLWGAAAPDSFNFGEFSQGDFFGSVLGKIVAESLTRVLYPDDSTAAGRSLRFVQEYFLVACSLGDIVNRFRRAQNPWSELPEKVAIQLNDTHPSLAVAELMRIFLDQGGLGWDEAWNLTVNTLAYTNHTLLPEALERWPVELFQRLLPRHLEIIYEINRRFLDDVRKEHPGDEDRARRMSIIEEGSQRKVRMAHLAVVGTHSTNGVAKIHSDLLRTHLLADFAAMFPQRFNNKTNGVTPRRWLLQANPALAELITDTIGDGWVTDLDHLEQLVPFAEDSSFRAAFLRAKGAAKMRFIDWLRSTTGQRLDPDSIFDCQIKRIHEYKRQLLNVLHIVMLYQRLREDPRVNLPPRTFLFAGKAAPAYHLAKLIIKLINNVAAVIDADPVVSRRLRVLFLADYNVTLAERLIPAADISEQISTAGYEASGTSNMKFMMNGALTVGTRDGATIEMAEAAGEENFFLFGLTAEQVAASRGWYNPWWHYRNEPAIRAALDLIFSNHFSAQEPGIFNPIRDTLLTRGDFYMHLADLTAYAQTQQRVAELYQDQNEWARKAIINVACSGPFSSDRTIAEYAREIWRMEPCAVE